MASVTPGGANPSDQPLLPQVTGVWRFAVVALKPKSQTALSGLSRGHGRHGRLSVVSFQLSRDSARSSFRAIRRTSGRR